MISGICTYKLRHVTSQEDISVSIFHPLNVASRFVVACCFNEEVTLTE